MHNQLKMCTSCLTASFSAQAPATNLTLTPHHKYRNSSGHYPWRLGCRQDEFNESGMCSATPPHISCKFFLMGSCACVVNGSLYSGGLVIYSRGLMIHCLLWRDGVLLTIFKSQSNCQLSNTACNMTSHGSNGYIWATVCQQALQQSVQGDHWRRLSDQGSGGGRPESNASGTERGPDKGS